MKRTLSQSEAVSLLMGDEYAKWSYKAATALVEHIQEVEDETGTEFEFCTVALRCDWTEYAGAEEIADAYNIPRLADLTNASDREEHILEWLDRKTHFITLPDDAGYLVRAF